MVQIRQTEREIQAQNTPQAYIDGGNTSGIGEYIPQSMNNVATGLDKVATFAMDYKDTVDRTNALALENAIYSEWEQPKLYDKEKGYYNQLGKNASGKSADVMKDFENFVATKQKELGLNRGLGQQYAMAIMRKRREQISRNVCQHDLSQTKEAEKAEIGLRIETINQQALHNRNNPDLLQENITNLKQSIVDFANNSNMDESQRQQAIINGVSNLYKNVIAQCCNENSLKGKEYLEQFKDDLTASDYVQLEKLCHNAEINVMSRQIVDSYVASGLNIEQAHKKIIGIKDLDLRDAVETRITHLYGQIDADERKVYNDKLDTAWEQVATSFNVSAIPNDIKAIDRQRMLDYIKHKGGIEDDNTYVNLYEMSIENAEDFAKLNLNQYRANLTDTQFVEFRKRQNDIASQTYTQVNSDDAEVVAIAKQLGLRGTGKKSITNIAQNLITAEEKQLGRPLSKVKKNSDGTTSTIYEPEAIKILENLGYKNAQGSTLNVIEQYGARADFYKNVARKRIEFKKTHGREPNGEEAKQLIWQEATNAKRKQIEYDYANIRSQIKAKEGETKLLTYYADNYIPKLSRQLGTKISVTSRYRPANGSYKSHHSDGTALDISMSEHSLDTKTKILYAQLKNPYVKAVGCSDEKLLNVFNSYVKAGKLVDERQFDKNNGTNHINHIHVTLNTNEPQNYGNRIIVVKDGRKYSVPASQLAQAEKKGYTKL